MTIDIPEEAVKAVAESRLKRAGINDFQNPAVRADFERAALAQAREDLAAALPHIEKAIRADEIEKCARTVEALTFRSDYPHDERTMINAAAAIRARKE